MLVSIMGMHNAFMEDLCFRGSLYSVFNYILRSHETGTDTNLRYVNDLNVDLFYIQINI